MNTEPFTITYQYDGEQEMATIHPCCKEDNIVDYAVWKDGRLDCTITKDMNDSRHWVVAVRNADDEFDDEEIQQIGKSIESHQSN